jgi:tight adherence protein B
MRLLAALLGGSFVYLLVAMLLRVAPNLELPARARPQISKRQLWLIQAGSELSPGQFAGGSVAAGVGAFILFWLIAQSPVIALVPAIAVGLLPRAYYARERVKRLTRVQEAWPDGIRDILAHVSSGATLARAVESLATAGPEPLRLAFGRFPLQARMFGVVPALEIVKEELADPTSDKVIEVLILSHDYGGDLIQDVLRDLVDAITEDLRTLEDIRTAGFEQRIESFLVVIVPWAVLLLLATVPADYREFYRSGSGQVVVMIGAIWSAFGLLVLRSIARDRGEHRVLGGGAVAEQRSGT